MGVVKIDEKGRVRCYPAGRKGFWKRIVSKAFRRACKQAVKEEYEKQD
jgi:hypothetical protein